MKKPRSASFDWLEPRRNPEADKSQQARREAMYRLELEERAALLHRLGHSKERARARLAANLDWDFSPGPSPLSPAALDAIVDRVFGQAGTGRPVPRAKAETLKGGTR
jgi:hypothetical protein